MENPADPVYACIVCCADPRVRPVVSNFYAQKFGENNYWLFSWPGGPKSLLDGIYSRHKASSISDAYKLRPFENIILVGHSDCGAYRLGGITFTDPAEERDFHHRRLLEARQLILHYLPDVIATVHLKYFNKSTGELIDF